MKVILHATIFLIISSSIGWAQDCKKCYARPEAMLAAEADMMRSIYSGEININSLSLKKAKRNEVLWKVFSDRSHNRILGKPDGPSVGVELDFMEAVYVTGVSDDGKHIHVDREEYRNGEYAFYPLGWVDIQTMVLTDRALSNKNGISRKGLVLVNLDNKGELRALEREVVENGYLPEYGFFDSPRMQGKPRSLAEKLEIRFVLKELDDASLMAVNDRIGEFSPTELKYNVNGWMRKMNITNWDTRVCLETTFGEEYKVEYSGRDIPVFINRSELNTFLRTGTTKEAIIKYKIGNEPMPSAQMRMPILENLNDQNIKRVATLASVDGEGALTDRDIARAKKLLEELRFRRNNINILFVLDATSSMRRYYPAVQKGIQDIVNANKARYKKSIKFAVSVYRDYEDGQNAHSLIPLTNDPDRIYSFLSQTETRSVAKSVHESLYNGILEGLKKSGMNKNNSNVVILIGDAGNHLNDEKGYTAELVSEELDKLNANFIAFQVYDNGSSAYEDFNLDAQLMLNGIGELSKTKQNLVPIQVQRPGENIYDLKFQDTTTMRTELYPAGGFARYVFSDVGGSMPISELKQKLAESLDLYFESIDAEIARNYEVLNNGSVKRADNYQKADSANFVFHLKNGGLTEEGIKRIFKHIDRFSLSGYTQMKYYNSSLECYKPVVFLTDKEVNDIISVFGRVNPKSNFSKARLEIYNSLLATVKAYTGESTDDIVKAKTLAEIWDIILKIPFDEAGRYGGLGDMRLEDFGTSKEAQMKKKFILEFQQSIGNFKKSNFKDYRFQLNGQWFYWVPIEDIPGNAG